MGAKDLSGRKNCDRRGRARRRGRRRSATRFEGRPFRLERIAFADDPGFGEPGHRILSKRHPAFPGSALRLRNGTEDPRLVVWNVRVRHPQQHEFSRDDATSPSSITSSRPPLSNFNSARKRAARIGSLIRCRIRRSTLASIVSSSKCNSASTSRSTATSWGRHSLPQGFEVTFEAPEPEEQYRTALGCPVAFGQPRESFPL